MRRLSLAFSKLSRRWSSQKRPADDPAAQNSKSEPRSMDAKANITSIVHHEPLHEGEIRLVDFGAGPGKPVLVNTRLDSKPDYIAISYSWGSQNCLHRFSINQQTLILTSSLYEVFVELWQQGYRGKIWADAVCIRQDDDDEKIVQIPMMHDIYQTAAEVFAWLGSGQFCDDIPMAVVDRLIRSCDFERDDGALFPTFEDAIEGLDLPPVPSRLWQDIVELLSSPWFGRLWTLQEAVIPARLFAGYGHTVFAWETLVLLAGALQRQHFVPFWARLAEDGAISGTLVNILATNTCRRDYNVKGLSMMTLFRYSRGRQVTRVQDRIYAMYGFMNAQTRRLNPIDLHASPDLLFTRAAKAMIALEPDLCLLANAETQWRLQGLPSWVPDLTAREPPWMLAGYCGYTAGLAPTIRPKLSVSLQDDKRHLLAAGLHFDTVVAAQSTGTEYSYWNVSRDGVPPGYARDFIHRIDLCRRLLQTSRDPPMSDNQAWSSLERVLVGDRPQWELWPWRTSPKGGTGHLQEVVAQMQRAAQGLSHDFGQSREYISTFLRFNVKRSLFITRTGHVGLGPDMLQNGDQILILRGGETPFAVREIPNETCYELLGESFVDGIMEGQAYQAHMTSGKEDTVFTFD